MPVNVKALIVVLALSGLVLVLAKGTALQFMEEGDFKRRRALWLFLSAAAFLSPNVWIFSLVAAPVLYWGGKKDTNPLALYLFLMSVIPSIPIQIPTNGLGIKQLFEIDIFRLLSFFVLVPAVLRIRKAKDQPQFRGMRMMDLLLLGYGVLLVTFYVPPDLPNHVILKNSVTNVLRDAFLFLIDSYALYYVASRASSSRRSIVDAMASFCLAGTIMATIAAFESVKHWLIYTVLFRQWGGDLMDTAYLFRAGLLRAQSSSGNSIVLGCLLAVAFGLWLYLRTRVERAGPRVAVTVMLWAGLLASFSRGPWLGALLIYFAYGALRPRGASRLIRSAVVVMVLGAITLASPIGERISATLPFLGGHVAESSLTYRERLAERSWQLIQTHPLLGDQLALTHMQALRQGQGIIDVVNTYVGLTLFHGFIGLALFLGFIFLALSRAMRTAKGARSTDPDLALLGASLAACIIGLLLMLADCSFILGNVTTFFALAGLASAYALLPGAPQPAADAGDLTLTSPEMN